MGCFSKVRVKWFFDAAWRIAFRGHYFSDRNDKIAVGVLRSKVNGVNGIAAPFDVARTLAFRFLTTVCRAIGAISPGLDPSYFYDWIL